MANYSIKLDLQKVPGAFLTNIKGKNETKKCLCIPIENSGLYVGSKGTYLNLAAIEIKDHKYEDTHLIKQNIDKDVYEAMTDEERKHQPILGGLHELKAASQEVNNTVEVNDDDLPF